MQLFGSDLASGWPRGVSRTPPHKRKEGRYRVGFDQAYEELTQALREIGGAGATLHADVDLNDPTYLEPRDPGFAVWIRRHRRNIVFCCDRYVELASNVRAVGLAVASERDRLDSGVRRIEDATKTGDRGSADKTWWHRVLGLSPGCTLEEARRRFRELAKETHPDARGGHPEAFHAIKAAWDTAQEELSPDGMP